jgi:hypothetical protein
MLKTKSYKFYSDSGHGWVAVKIDELINLGIADKISRYSYRKNQTAYLEEDGDMTLFVRAKMARGEIVTVKEKHSDRSVIRSYSSYRGSSI